MKAVYPTILIPDDESFLVKVPDLEIETEGYDMADAIEMARDAIGLKGICLEDMGKKIPEPSPMSSISTAPGETLTLVDIDCAEYRLSVDNKAVRKNLSIPNWLNVRAEKAGINFSKVLQDALISALDIQSMAK